MFKFRNYEIKIEDVTIFVKEPDKEQFFIWADDKTKIEGRWDILVSNIVKITQGDKELKIEDFKKVHFPYAVFNRIVREFSAAMYSDITKPLVEAGVTAEKNDESPTV